MEGEDWSVGLALTPRPPLPMLGEGEHDTAEGEDRQRGDSPPPARGRVASLKRAGWGPPADASASPA